MNKNKAYISHKESVRKLSESLVGNTKSLKLKKKTISNIFRYGGRDVVKYESREVDLSRFNNPLHIDVDNKTLDVQGLTTNETIADYTLKYNLLPLVIPGLKHITIGGAIVGIGFESTSFKYGFVHDCLIEAEVLLPGGKVVICSATENEDLFFGLPNSFGTLGYILRAKIKLREVSTYVTMNTSSFSSIDEYLFGVKTATKDESVDYIESLVYSEKELYLTTGVNTDNPTNLISIYGSTIFYKEISKRGTISLNAKDYLFRFDPEWFWGLPEKPIYELFRLIAPPIIRNSRTYSRYFKWQQRHDRGEAGTKKSSDYEELIQDWLILWKNGKDLLEFALKNVDLDGKPWMPTPISSPATASFYPMQSGELYLNLGSYTFVKRKPDQELFYSTKILDKFCFSNGGIKMLYSSTFLSENEFARVYNGYLYDELKDKYDPASLAPALYEKIS